ncbi:hypothetical protein GY21_03565 [Cryobacterium roopkundense]|uniref:Lipoprotein n=1 Tax=Cryobacterium roopkundense TaxID=1001240 RepID=A0A099JRA4_9MICO|nr:hypothetical protein [Cryobacterium roopkundense]KGJ79968.1 hypothetical protein GY21_03565 [Cryobacterium roopkundense]MBB5643112.1 hypothetical protein [Cryobacterium roopkundense]
MKLLSRALALTLGLLLLSGCVAAEPAAARPVLRSETALSADFLTLAADADPVVNALLVSAALYRRAELVVTAPVGNDRAQLLAASAAVDLGVPLLLTPSFGASTTAAVSAELTRLHASYVVSVGGGGRSLTATSSPEPTGRTGQRADARTLLTVPATPVAVNALLPEPLRVVEVASAPEALSALARLDPLHAALLTLPSASTATPTPSSGKAQSLPRVTRARPLVGEFMLAADDPAQLAGVATARAASVDVALVPALRPNPQASTEVVAALGAATPGAVLALGLPFAAEPGLDYKVRAAATGVQLPGGGQLLFPGRRFVALYGTPGTPVLGVLGERPVTEAIVRAQQLAATYQPLSDRPVVPMHEIIVTVASAGSGPDGNYSSEIPAEQLRPWVEAAGAAGLYVVLDLQPGRTDFLTQAQQYAGLLELPYVGLALDPEWRLAPEQRHLVQIGSADIAEINSVVSWLAALTSDHALPQKLLVLHQFRSSMIQNRPGLDMTHPELALLLHVDGLGGQPDKQATWSTLHADAPAGVAWGWKNFYDEDQPMLTPEQTMTLVLPTPDLVTYQ